MDIEKTSRLAAIKLTDEEKQRLKPELERMVSVFNKISEVNTEGFEPLIQPRFSKTHLRVDKAQASGVVESILEQAPDSQGQLFKVPPVLS